MFLAPCAVGGFFTLLFALTLHDLRLDASAKPARPLHDFASAFSVDPRDNPVRLGIRQPAHVSSWPTRS